MKILCISDLMDPASGGGATDRDYQMCRHLALAGHEVDLLTTKWSLDKAYMERLEGVRWHAVNAVYLRYLVPWGVRRWLRPRIARYDIVHISKNWSLLASTAAAVASANRVPFVFSGMGFIAIHNRSRLLKGLYRKFLTFPLLRRASAFIAVTEQERSDLLEVGAAPQSIHRIPNGIIPADFTHRDDAHFHRRHKLPDRKIILFIGRMDPIKGVHLLIDAYRSQRAELQDWIVVLVGTRTAYRTEMQRKVAAADLQRHVFFLEPIFGADKSEAYHAAEFVAIPSIKDSMTIIAPEAACCRKPVLITRTSEFSELPQHGGAVEVEPTVEGIAQGLRALTDPACDRVAMGERGHGYVMANFPWPRVISRYVDVFATVAGKSCA